MTTFNDQQTLIKKYGIYCIQKTIYCYKKKRFYSFQDALNFAALEQDVTKEHLYDSHK